MYNKLIFIALFLNPSISLLCMQPNPPSLKELAAKVVLKRKRKSDIDALPLCQDLKEYLHDIRLLPAKEFIKKASKEFEKSENDLQHALSRAIAENRAYIISDLIDLGAQINAPETEALILAAMMGHYKVVEVLLVHKAQIDAKDSWGKTALMWASYEGHYEIVKKLLTHGAQVDLQSYSLKTPLMYAIKKGHYKIVKELLIRGTCIDWQNHGGKTALIIAASHGYYEIAKELMVRGAEIDIHDKYADTALIKAIKHTHMGLVKLLLRAGASINKEGQDRQTPLILATKRQQYEIVKKLLIMNARIDIPDEYSKTAMMYAQTYGYKKIEQLLKEYEAHQKPLTILQEKIIGFVCTIS